MATIDAPLIVLSRAEFADSFTLARYLETGGYVALRKALTMFPEDVAAEVDKASLLGRGGAGFPGRTQVVDAAQVTGLVSRGQRRRIGTGDIQGSLPGRARPPSTGGRCHHRGLRAPSEPGLSSTSAASLPWDSNASNRPQ